MTTAEVISQLRAQENASNVAGMARFGIASEKTLGIPIPVLRALAKRIGTNHRMALELWESGIHEARTLAGFIDDPVLVTKAQMDAWAADFDSWDVCDQVCSSLFDRTPFAWAKAAEWTDREEEFVRRAGFALICALTVHDKKAADADFLRFLPLISERAGDPRNFVKKAANWALRQIGKRSAELYVPALQLASELSERSEPSARWIGKDAYRELAGRAPKPGKGPADMVS